MGFLSKAFRDQIMSPIGRPVSAIGVRPMLREPGIDIVGEKSIFGQPNPFGTPIPPARSPLQNAFDNIQKQIPQRPPSIGGVGGINQPFQPVLQQPQPPQTGGIPVTGGGPLGSGILPIANLPTGPVSPPTNIGIQIPDNPVGGGFLKRVARNVKQQIRNVNQQGGPQSGTMLPIMPPVALGSPEDLARQKQLREAMIAAGDDPDQKAYAFGGGNGLEKMPVPPKREDFMSIGGPGGGYTPGTSELMDRMVLSGKTAFDDSTSIGGPGGGLPNVSQVSTIGQEIAVPGTGTPPPQTGLTPAELLQLSDEELQRYIPRENIGFGVGANRKTIDSTPSPSEFRQNLQSRMNLKPGDRGYGMLGQQTYRPVDAPSEFVPPQQLTTTEARRPVQYLANPAPTPVPDPVIQPAVTDPTAPTEPVTTPTDTTTPTEVPVAPIDPVLMQQSASEVISDPLLRSLYFGTADSPGFYNQLQQAGSNLIGSDVPLQQTAGLTPLELLARQQAVAGLGGFEPFLQQNRNLVNQAIQQSRRAEQLQDPYYTQAEEIYKDTMGAYDPSMTQQFYNPYEDAVVQQTIEDVMKAGDKQDIAARAREISSGAFGGSRARLGAEERRQDLGEGLAKALSGIRSQGFQSAQATGLGEFARQQQAKRTGAQGLMGIGVGRGSAASNLGQQLAGFGGQLTGLGRTQEELRRGQRGELAGYGGIGRGIAETGLSRIYDQMLAQQYRPMQTLQQIGGMLPGYQASSSRIDSQYGMPTDPAAAGLGAAFSAYGAVAPRQGSG